MSEKITVPTLGESVTEATVSKWLKSQGEEVSADEPLVELETDKVNVEVPSPSSGVLGSIVVKEGETVNVGALLGTVNGSLVKSINPVKEVNDYSPPNKKNETKEPKIFVEKTDVNAKLKDGTSALHMAARVGNIHVLRWLIEEAGAFINIKNSAGYTPAHFAW